MGPEGPRLTRRGPGRPPFRKAQSAACMEISLPVSHTEGVCLSPRLPSLNLSNLPLLLTSACHARTPGVSGIRPDAWLTHGKPMLMQVSYKQMKTKGLHCKTSRAESRVVECLSRDWEVMDLMSGRVSPKAQNHGLVLGHDSCSHQQQWTFGLILCVWKLIVCS